MHQILSAVYQDHVNIHARSMDPGAIGYAVDEPGTPSGQEGDVF
jgi:hypothetical protein